jgi:RNase P subunit RPR2
MVECDECKKEMIQSDSIGNFLIFLCTLCGVSKFFQIKQDNKKAGVKE